MNIGSGNEALTEIAIIDTSSLSGGSLCGDTATWRVLSGESGDVLLLSGSGAVTSAPWENYYPSSRITGLEIGNGITDVSAVLSSLTSINGVTGDDYSSSSYPLHWVNTDEGMLHIFGSAGYIRSFPSNHETWVNPVYGAIVHEGVKYLGTDFFDSPLCATMTSVSLPGTLVEIAERGFKGTAIKSITLPEDCTTVRILALDNCSNLDTIIVTGTMPQNLMDVYGRHTFDGVSATIRYPYDNGYTASTLGGLTCRSYCAYSGGILEHNLTHVEALEPTCTEDGNREYWHCSICGTYFTDVNCNGRCTEEETILSATGHIWSVPIFNWPVQDGVLIATFICQTCNDTIDVEAEVTSEIAQEPTCTEPGLTTYTASVNAPEDPETVYSDTQTFADIDALGHDEIILIEAQAPTCTEDGWTEEIFCLRCETYLQMSETIPARGHTEVVRLEALEPTCEQDGYTEERVCAVCGAILKPSEVLPALGHLWSFYDTSWIEDGSTCTMRLRCERDDEIREFSAEIFSEVLEAATCTEMGTTLYTAILDVGENSFVDTLEVVDIDLIPHTPAIDAEVAPTDHEAGLTEGSHCAVCGEVLAEQQVIPAIYTWDGTTITGYTGSETEITLPSDAEALSDTAFRGNTDIVSVTIPKNVLSVGSLTFYNCTALEKVVIEGDVTGINGTTFRGASNVSFYVEAGTEAARLLSFRGYSFITEEGWVVRYTVASISAQPSAIRIENQLFASGKLIIPDELYGCPVTELLPGAFAGNTSLTRIIFPDSVSIIGSGAFADCQEALTLYSGAESVARAYAEENAIHWQVYPLDIQMDAPDMLLPGALSMIEEEAFMGVDASVIELPESVTEIGNRAFADCTNLRQIYIPGTVTSIGEDVFRNCALNLVIFGKAGSEAERYAEANGFDFVHVE